MFGRDFRFIAGLAIAAGLIFIILLLVFSHGHSSPGPAPLASYAYNPTAQASLLIDGPTDAPQDHNQVQINISDSTATINIFKGYNDQVQNSANYAMTNAAFHVFLRSLEDAGFQKGTPNSTQASGYCPTGDRYIFSFNVNGSQIERYWTTSCGGDGNFGGSTSLTMQLFENEIPNYGNLVSNVNI